MKPLRVEQPLPGDADGDAAADRRHVVQRPEEVDAPQLALTTMASITERAMMIGVAIRYTAELVSAFQKTGSPTAAGSSPGPPTAGRDDVVLVKL